MRFNRSEALVGENRFAQIQNHTILIFGLGGVGSFAAEAIARSGFHKIILVDQDRVDITNINRQLIALDSTVGMAKVEVMKARILDIYPECLVTTFESHVSPDNIELFFTEHVDFVLDCIDDMSAKIAIATFTDSHQIPLIAAMGFANKQHPEQISITTVNKSSVCPLAKSYRSALRKQGLPLNTTIVFSTETPVVPKGNVKLASTAFVPSSAGLLMASYVFNELLTKGEIS